MYTDLVKYVRRRRLVPRLARATAGCLLGGAMLVPLGPTTTSQAVNQMNATSMRGVPSVASRPVVRDSMVWVPERAVRLLGEGTVMVPGHWERRLPEGREVYVSPLTVRDPETGATTTLPAATRRPVDERTGP
jgi:hypothetical protein